MTELVPSMTYEKYEEHLDSLVEKREIVSWENNGKETINYVIKYTREKLASMSKESIEKQLKLVETESENFTILDEHGKLKIFESIQDMLKYFVDFRSGYFLKRKEYQLNKIKNDIIKLEYRALFIKLVIDNIILVNNRKKEDIIKDIVKNNIPEIDGSHDFLLSMPIYNLTKEKYNDILQTIKDKKIEEKEIKKSVPKEVYIAELEQLLKEIK